jgi:hypothetical protein
MMADSDLEDKYSKYNFDDDEEDLEDKYSKYNFDDDEEDLEDKYSKFNFDDDEEEEAPEESESKTYKRPTSEELEASRNRIIEGTGFDMRFRKKKKRRVKKSRKKV